MANLASVASKWALFAISTNHSVTTVAHSTKEAVPRCVHHLALRQDVDLGPFLE